MNGDMESNVRHLSTYCSTALTATCTTCCTDALQTARTLKVGWGSGGGVFDRRYRKRLKILSRPPSFVDTNACWTVGCNVVNVC